MAGGSAEMGQAIGRSGDGGIDGTMKEDALGLDIVYVQAKRYGRRTPSVGGRGAGLRWQFGRSPRDQGCLRHDLDSSARGAREFVQRIAKRIVLVDGKELARLMIRHGVGVRTRTTYELKKID